MQAHPSAASMKPGLHSHVELPGVLVHSWLQHDAPSEHSSMSESAVTRDDAECKRDAGVSEATHG